MNKAFSLLITSVCFVTILSCQKIIGNGPVVTENRNTGEFSAVASAISADVYYRQGANYAVKISAQQNVLNVIEAHVSGNELLIKHRNGIILGKRERTKIEITSPQINGFRVSGSGKIIAGDTIRSQNFSASVSGSGSIRIENLMAGSVAAKIRGSGDISVSGGQVHQADLTISGSGDINTMNLPADYVTTKTSGSGKMRIHAEEMLDVTISGSGSVYYLGNPQVNMKISGSGKVVKQ